MKIEDLNNQQKLREAFDSLAEEKATSQDWKTLKDSLQKEGLLEKKSKKAFFFLFGAAVAFLISCVCFFFYKVMTNENQLTENSNSNTSIEYSIHNDQQEIGLNGINENSEQSSEFKVDTLSGKLFNNIKFDG